ncbi:MAG: hypothetical protein GX316_11135 [Firmicutes bacterium]|nr:hypothetical protein [Bacillota bacterium]
MPRVRPQQIEENQCIDEFNELICVTFDVIFTVTAVADVIDVECMGPCLLGD